MKDPFAGGDSGHDRRMAMGAQTALKGVTGRLTGRRASRVQALAAALGAAFVTYRFLRSGSDVDSETEGD